MYAEYSAVGENLLYGKSRDCRKTWFAVKQIVDDVRLLERVERQQVGSERGAVLTRLVPARVERREPIARRPRADLAELRQTR